MIYWRATNLHISYCKGLKIKRRLFSLNFKMRPHKFKNPRAVNEKCRINFFSVAKTFFQRTLLIKSSHRGKILNVSGVFSLQEE